MAAIYKNVAVFLQQSEQGSVCIYHAVVCYICPLLQNRNKLQPPLHMLQGASTAMSLYVLKGCQIFSPPTQAGQKAEQLCRAYMPVFRRRWLRAFIQHWMQIPTSVPRCYYHSELWEELILQASSSTLLLYMLLFIWYRQSCCCRIIVVKWSFEQVN